MNKFNSVSVPLFSLDENGAIKPNPLFHRPIDKLHSRCIEYPFAASQLGDAQRILDVGTVKSDPAWINWLEALPIEVHATDYDPPKEPYQRIQFHQADVRRLSLPDNTFDTVLAVSVIEHIGLEAPLVDAQELPTLDQDGDVEAVRELTRVLKPGGRLIMTFPYGLNEGAILSNSARTYTKATIKRFEMILCPILLDYYEYQYRRFASIIHEYPAPLEPVKGWQKWFQKNTPKQKNKLPPVDTLPELPGMVTWRRIPIDQTQAYHNGHVEGILCSVWKKGEST